MSTDPPLLQEWVRKSKRASVIQYASQIRRYVRTQGVTDLKSATAEQLTAYVRTIGPPRVRIKAISALVAFFDDLVEQDTITKSPARHLAARVRQADEMRDLYQSLLAAGITEQEATSISWRDVAIAVLGQDERATIPPERARTLVSPIRAHLSDQLFRRIQATTVDQLNTVLDQPVLVALPIS